jgi:hypothetical protein
MWLLKGDSNTAFFSRVANGKKRKNTIFSLKHNDHLIEGDEALVEHATQFYKDLFGPSTPADFHMESGCWDPAEKVNIQDNKELEKPFSKAEIKNSIFSMKRNTAPGPDHFHVEFYQYCWDVIKDDLVALFIDFHNMKLDICRFNYGIITLLPKIKEANNIKQYRPICLLNVIYKIFTKALMLRLDKVMGRIINRRQSGFLKDQNIMDGILALHEILHDTKIKKKGLILKLDFEKAYDKLNWAFFFECLRQRGFWEKWCDWIKLVMSSSTVSVKMNNTVGKYFKSGRGVR